MNLVPVWTLLHLFFSFAFVGTLVLAEWNGRAARVAQDWSLRAVLFYLVHRASGIAGLGALLALGVFGNLLSAALGYRMAVDTWMRWVNGLWLVAVAVQAFGCLPAAGALARIARAAAAGGGAEGWDATLVRWRIANGLQSALYAALLGLMVFRWRS